ncbi:hypothetical protein BIV57_18155 [Mangrovactinospora gilvigrisea]|uniref:Type II toxin-antitoxin system RelE/ParE family toxin n=1 Tax=Mangrovactinospora gilvigrisea TaxID=1428644 RepID=A0A1J7BBQ7_9ACTN|nr:type II toxin-antitoxin system RelE/ParE family toxin [Mangrovactinospora gilvigrisea]OIV36083.1 hypothetical protein BIV57_18155 [Mangrovactinospora gilvigrisea]
MSPKHGQPRRAAIRLSEEAEAQVEKLAPQEVLAVERALAALAVAPDLGEQLPNGFRDYRHDEHVRILYFLTALRTIVVVAYIEA